MTFWQTSNEKLRLDIFLSQNLHISRSQIAQLIDKDGVKINGKIAKKSGIKLNFGDTIEVDSRFDSHKSHESLAPKSDIIIERIYEDSDILVLNKPPFLATHGAPSLKEESLVDWLKAHKIQLSTISGQTREGIVHRLDKQTSGALVVAKNNIAHSLLSAQLADKSMGRIYLAIIDSPLKCDIEVECFLARNPKNRLKMAKFVPKNPTIYANRNLDSRESRQNLCESPKDSRESQNDSPKIPRFARYSKSKFTKLLPSIDGRFELICAQLFTGRTHQIRAHLESLNRHILGDELYGYKAPKNGAKYRVMLHSYILYLFHPKNAKMSFRAPLFSDMRRVLEENFDMERVNEILHNLG